MGKTFFKWADPIGSKKKGKVALKKKEEKAIAGVNAEIAGKQAEADAELATAQGEELTRRRAAYATSTYRFTRGTRPRATGAEVQRKVLLG